VLSSSLRLSQNDGLARASWVMTRPIVGARAQALVVAGLLWQVGEQVPQPPPGERQELSIVGDAQEHLGHGERDELGVGDPRRTPRPAPLGQEIVHAHVKCREQSVEVGAHETTSVVDVAVATPTFGALVMSPCGRPRRPNTESTI
jgi:hypothetical protein